jgi:hypothetical protein
LSLRPIGGIYARLDSSSNLTFYDASGTVLAKFISGKLSTTGNFAQILSNAQNHSTSASLVSTGVGVQFTPQVSTTARIAFNSTAYNATLNDGVYMSVYRSTTAIPAVNNAPGGGDTELMSGSGPAMWSSTANANGNLAAFFTDSGPLVPGTLYYYYIVYRIAVGGTAYFQFPSLTVWES